MRFVIACVRAWTWIYTHGLPGDERATRQREIESDLWESMHDEARPSWPAVEIARRLLLGIPDDLMWRVGGVDGEFDFVAEVPLPPPPPGAPNPFDAPFGSIFTVLPDQLGLKLESTRGPVEVLVIDRIDRPSSE